MQATHADRRRSPRAKWGRAIGRAIRAHQRHSSKRREYRGLLRLDDRILRDIGVTRDMVHHEMQKPFHWLR